MKHIPVKLEVSFEHLTSFYLKYSHMNLGRGKSYILFNNDANKETKKELALIKYEPSSDNPTSTKIFSVDFSDEMIDNLNEEISPKEESKKTDLNKEIFTDIFSFQNVNPYYDDENKCYKIDFSKHTNFFNSSKNFQAKWKSKDILVVEQVKVDKNEFELRLRWPFNILTAFALSVSMFDPKLVI